MYICVPGMLIRESAKGRVNVERQLSLNAKNAEIVGAFIRYMCIELLSRHDTVCNMYPGQL